MKQLAIVGVLVFAGMFAPTTSAQDRPGLVVMGQDLPAPLPPRPLPRGGFKVDMLAVEPFEIGEPVEDAPYSAEIVNEATQDLTDGNRIERRTTGAVARDGRGRVRREHQLAAIGPKGSDGAVGMVTISDPVAGIHYALDPVRKVAMRSRPARVHAEIAAAASSMIISQHAGPDEHLEVRGEPAPPDVRTEQLGTREYEGVRVEGTRTVATLPAGVVGNVRPIEIVSERWYSPELRVVVFSRRADPRFGETIYRLTNISRAEPEASLFQVPADYEREDVKAPFFEAPIDR